ncbi:MAG TPA: secretin N-terminal domain-containing protein [Pyrinomonadaceae bacterium]|nr:secretin N-terminal domain-containing protein [Pyrinomonadaceae bacterium]
MKSFALARPFAALLMTLVLLASPIAVLAKKGEKNFKRGMQFEQAQQWEKAAQEFALAVAASPSDTEYQLHFRRAVFNASQSYMAKGKALAEQGDYIGAYNAYRQSYGLDPVNDLASQEMDRMLRLQREKEGTSSPNGVKNAPTSFRGQAGVRPSQADGQADGMPNSRTEQLQTVQYSGDLEGLIRKLADELSLNVVFDQNFSQVKRTVNIKWKDITPARALDYVFLSQGLFFQKLDRRTILVADQSKRPMYQQLVLRTFYLFNIKPSEARTLLTGALPANSGRQPQFIENVTTNSITVRDTSENMRIVEKLLASVDKDRAEVVMEVSIYEITRIDLLQIGNQIGNATTLGNLGGIQPGSVLVGGARQIASGAAGVFPLSTGLGLLIPATAFSAVQGKTNTRLIFSTQVHAFDDEKSETRIGAKVPVQTAAVFNGLSTGTTPPGGNPNQGVTNPGVFGNGFPVIQYEDTGLVLDFKPKVYPNQDVQVTMNIETKDTNGDSLTPTFTQRKISGVARIPNGKTMMIASISQDRESNGRTGLPLIGLIPILGRLFTAPRKDNTQSDIVITMTPRVLRAPEILPSDSEERRTGTMQTPESPSLEAMVRDAEREEHFAKQRALPTNQTVQLPPQPGEEVTFVPAPKALAEAAASGATTGAVTATNNSAPQPAAIDANATAATALNVGLSTNAPASPVANNTPAPAVASDAHANPAPAPASEKATGAANPNVEAKATETAKPNEASSVAQPAANSASNATAAAQPAPSESAAELLLLPEQQELKVGERKRLMLFLKTDAPLGLATATLRFDPRSVAVRSISQGMLATSAATAPVLTQSLDMANGVLLISVSPAAGAQPLTGEGLLLVIEIEGLAPGDSALQFDADKVHLIATDGRNVRARVSASKFKVTQ